MWLLFILLFLVEPIYAQDASPSAIVDPSVSLGPTTMPAIRLFDQYQRDYLFQYDIYQRAYLNYVDKVKVYTKYGTITTQKDKFNAAINAINARNKAFKSYFLALRVFLDDYKTSNPTITEKNQIDLRKWETWFDEQLIVVPLINNDDDLKKWINDFKDKYPEVQQTIYTALVQHEINLRQQSLNTLQDIAANIKNNPNIKPESEQWISNLAVKSDLVSTGFGNAINLTQRNQNQNKFSNFYPDAKIELTKTNNYIGEISADLKLIIIQFLKP